jgi:hypothetical protein
MRRAKSRSFVNASVAPKHQFQKVMIVSGDRESEVRYRWTGGHHDIHAYKSPEESCAIVR